MVLKINKGWEHLCSSLVPAAVIKYWPRSNVGEERIYFSLDLAVFEESLKLKLEPGGRSWSRPRQGAAY